MEENKVFIPKPPKSLQKAPPKPEPEQKPQEKPVLPEPPTFEKPFEEVQIDEKQPKQKKEKRKLNFEPASNWVGFFVSLAVLGVFVFLLVIN